MGWWVEDFTLAELKTSTCERTFAAASALATRCMMVRKKFRHSKKRSRSRAEAGNVGIYPELKHPTFPARAGFGSRWLRLAGTVQFGSAGRSIADNVCSCSASKSARSINVAGVCPPSAGSDDPAHVSSSGGPWDRQQHERTADMLTDAGLQRDRANTRSGIGTEKVADHSARLVLAVRCRRRISSRRAHAKRTCIGACVDVQS